MSMRLLTLLLVLAVETGCPHAWARGGTIEMAVRKDMTQYFANRTCRMSERQWLELCDNRGPKETSPKCPKECRPPPEAD